MVLVLLHHMPPPVVLSREGLAPLARIRAGRLDTMVLAGLVVLVVDVAVQMRLSAKLLVAPGMDAFVRALMVSLMVTVAGLEAAKRKKARGVETSTYFNLWICSKTLPHSSH